MKRNGALDLARVAAMLSVMLIHVTSTYIYNESRLTLFGINPAFFLNQVTRFAVPLFLFLSGVSLRLRGTEESPAAFWKKRLRKVGVPYLLWFLVYALYECDFQADMLLAGIAEAPGRSLRALLLGQPAPHLYFIVILLQLYLLYPIMEKTMERSAAGCVGAALFITFSVQCLYHFRRNGLDLIPAAVYPYLWVLFPTWIFYFALGAAVDRERLARLGGFAARNRGLLLGAAALYAVYYVVDARLTGALDAIKLQLLPFTPLVFLGVLALWEPVCRVRALRKAAAFLARHSMSMYFCHVLLLCEFRKLPFFARGMRGMLALFPAVLLSSAAAAFVLDAGTACLRRKD